TVTANSQADLDTIAACETLTGDLVLASTFVTASINGVRAIEGDLDVSQAVNLTSLSAPSLGTIGGTFQLVNLTVLNSLNFPQLSEVGTINWITLPNLYTISFASGVQKCESVLVADTALRSLSGISLSNVSALNINNNRQLSELVVQASSISGLCDISFNGRGVVASFPELIWARNLTFRDVANVSIPSLVKVNESLGFISNSFESIFALNLTEVGGSFAIVNNNDLTSLSFPVLKEVGGGFQIANNSALTNLSSFPELETIGGAVDLLGSFEEADFPSLDLVSGGVNVETDQDFDCDGWTELKNNGDIQGDSFACSAKSS
ncbi:hypothetical protein CANCADRAFT_16899, partial [Tortispora caseinolytica NRRL Y-17796]